MPVPYIANEIVLELDFTGQTATDGVQRGKVQVECWITDYQINKSGGSTESTTVATLCPTGLYNLANKATAGGYNLNLGYLNDWCSTDAADTSLSWLLVLYPNAKNVPFRLLDRAGCNTGIDVEGVISELPDFEIGGQAGQVSSVSGAAFPLSGKPKIAKASAGALATGAVAGTPGHWTGLLGFITPTFANAPTPSPATAWSTGQYILDSTKTEGYWNGTAWVSGQRAP